MPESGHVPTWLGLVQVGGTALVEMKPVVHLRMQVRKSGALLFLTRSVF